MKARELRIGNIIGGTYTDDGNELYDICKVVTLDSVGAAEYPIWVEGKANIEKYDAFDPIKLDEEWLLKFGFKNCCDLWVWYIDKFELQEMEDVDGNSTGYGYAIDGVVEDLIIKYVHQLQNLYFALTGKELHYTL